MAKDKNSSRAGRDVAGVGPDPRTVRHLTPLRELKHYRVASGEPEITGWHVYTSSGRDIGTVEDMLVDTTIGQVAMLEIDLHDADRRTLVPIRAAWIDREHVRVILDGAQFDEKGELPWLSRTAPITDDEVQRFDRGYARWESDRAVEQRPVAAVDAARQPDAQAADERTVRFPPVTDAGTAPLVVEETVVRRRLVDPSEIEGALDQRRSDGPGA